MKPFINPKYLERYEDVVFGLEQHFQTPANNAPKLEIILNSLLTIQVKLLHLTGIMLE